MSKPKLKPAAASVTVAELIAKLEGEVQERQKAIALLRSTCIEAMKGRRGRPSTYGPEMASRIGELTAKGKTQRWIAEALGIPIATVGRLAKRVGAKRAGTRGPNVDRKKS
jgi:CRP-like cAMP-binding protein